MRERIVTLHRASVIAQTLMKHGLTALVDQLGLWDKSLVRAPERGEKVAARFGRRLSLALNELGPTFVKLGQLLSTREDMLPAPIIAELAQLQDNVKPVSVDAVAAEIERALGHRPEAIFARFDREPLAAGSIGQVHRARTRDGNEVVVKVRRPKLERVVESDLALLRSLAELACKRSPAVARHDPVAFVDEFGRSLRAELDFAREADATERMRVRLRRTALVPRVYRELSADSVLVLEYVEAAKVTTLTDDDHRRRAARQLVACFATQMFRAGEFHADPHAGNVVRAADDGRLVLFDMGATGALDPGMRSTLDRLRTAAGLRDGASAAQIMLDMVHVPEDFDDREYQAEMSAFLDKLLSRPLSESDWGHVIREALTLARRHGLRMRADYFLLLRATILVDGVLKSLDPALDPLRATRSFILRSWLTREWFTTATRLVFGTLLTRVARVLPARRAPRQLPERSATS